MTVARELDFKVAMIYQGLDFERRPQPVARVAADFVTFRDRFAKDPVFIRLGCKPLTIWSGTVVVLSRRHGHGDGAGAC